MSENDHRIHIVGRVNMQYYLIRYYEHYYLLDYSDPLQIENYGPLFFFNSNKQFTVYDVEGDKEQFLRRAKHRYLNFKQAIIGWILFLCALVILCPIMDYDNLSNLDWYLHTFVRPLFILVIFILLIALNLKINIKHPIDVSSYRKSTLELMDVKESSIWKKVSIIVGNYFLLWLSLNIGMYTASVVLLIILGFLYPYFVIFNRFIVCSLDRVGDKKSYQIKERLGVQRRP
ncbi:hypothetical protein [Bombilactobacillus thymidiniphilus]|uniref:DUF443 family protein n=1 Tax=Bombilactobacillus thymidiniphilus TaxID=2923363 RepID=A0ABY4PBM2_9LACO|nr:hypothetical protein [Bombilactobacillus thymidiniphilus]UQS83063.1 hypothetical protein MOO47_04565 [Bombilactobacillus thymidiniphilus]